MSRLIVSPFSHDPRSIGKEQGIEEFKSELEKGIIMLRDEGCSLEHKEKILEHIRSVRDVVKKTPPFTDDIAIDVGDHKVHCSEWILTRQSEVFKQRFSGPWKEVAPKAPKGEEVAMEIFFRWLNDFEFEVPETATAEDLLHFLHELNAYELSGMIDLLIEKGLDKELVKRITPKDCFQFFCEADRFVLPNVWEKTLRQLYKGLDDEAFIEAFKLIEEQPESLSPQSRTFLINALLNYGITRLEETSAKKNSDPVAAKVHALFEKHLSQLTMLQTDGLHKLSDKNIAWLMEKLPDSLSELNLSHLPFRLIPKDYLAKFSHLRSLILQHCPSLVNLQAIQDLKELTTLDITGCETLTNIRAVKSLPNLKSFRFTQCPKITSAMLQDSLGSHPGLKSMQVSYDERLESTIQRIAKIRGFTLI